MSGFGAGSPYSPWMSGAMGYAAEARQLAGLGMHSHAASQLGQMQQSFGQLHGTFNDPVAIAKRRAILTEAKPTEIGCAYCGGPDYSKDKCPGCGARTKEIRCKS